MMEGQAGKQIPLAFSRFNHLDFDLFEAGENALPVEHLRGLLDGEDRRNIVLWGPAGSGKSHLLQALCTHAADNNRAVVYVPLKEKRSLSPDLLEGLEHLALACLDDLDAIAGDGEWELALFHLFNRMRETGTPMVMSVTDNPRNSLLQLPDLVSRLSWDHVYHLLPPGEKESLEALKKRALSRGFVLPDEVAVYLYRRVSRDTHSLFHLLDKLDRASLVEKRKLTIPFVRALLDDRSEDSASAG